ncbi:MAG: hypothetical protein ACI33N_05655 [Desulfovibrionaceae bacterium]|nr:hypothetical protein [Desulfovibrionaceae bacterium]
MSDVLFWLHPLMQVFAAALGLWAMWQGVQRFRMTHGVKVLFPWRQHVKLGAWALALWLLGALGFYVTHSIFGETHITGAHAFMAWPVMLLAVIGLGTGYVMDRWKRRRVWMPLVHGALNVLLLVLVAAECWTGVELWESFGG